MKHVLLIVIFVLAFLSTGWTQGHMLVVEAESGTLGDDFEIREQDTYSYIASTSNDGGNFPGTVARVASFQVSLPAVGEYYLFVRLRVGADGANDDSFFYGNGFGTKSETEGDDWITVNQLSLTGYDNQKSVVYEDGGAGNLVWKWVNLSAFSLAETKITFSADEAGKPLTFQIGGREDGLEIDKFVFAPAGLYYTVKNLDNGEEGSVDLPEIELGDKPLAYGLSKYVGCAYASHTKDNFEKYWNQVVPENAGKWGSAEPSRDVMSWGQLDEAYNFALKNNLPYRHHVLVWGNQQPEWIENLPASEQLEEIREWFQAVANRYPKAEIVEVVNEALHDPPSKPDSGGGNYINALGGTGQTGYDWIVNAFKMARQYFPATTKLMLNEYGITDNANNARRYKTIIDLLKSDNLIDVVGVQGHSFNTGVSASTIKSNLDIVAQAGLPIYITEMDVDGETDAIQLAAYKKIFTTFWEHPAVKGVTLWGFRPGMWRTDERAFLVNSDGTEREAMTWLRDYLRGFLSADEIQNTPGFTIYPNPVFSGAIQIIGAEEIRELRFFSTSGQLIKSFAADNQHIVSVDIDFTPGIYVVQLISNKQITTRKIVVK